MVNLLDSISEREENVLTVTEPEIDFKGFKVSHSFVTHITVFLSHPSHLPVFLALFSLSVGSVAHLLIQNSACFIFF